MRIFQYLPLVLLFALAACFTGCASTAPTQSGTGDSDESGTAAETAETGSMGGAQTDGDGRRLMDRYKTGDIPGYRD